jgi:hypothetical protein
MSIRSHDIFGGMHRLGPSVDDASEMKSAGRELGSAGAGGLLGFGHCRLPVRQHLTAFCHEAKKCNERGAEQHGEGGDRSLFGPAVAPTSSGHGCIARKGSSEALSFADNWTTVGTAMTAKFGNLAEHATVTVISPPGRKSLVLVETWKREQAKPSPIALATPVTVAA